MKHTKFIFILLIAICCSGLAGAVQYQEAHNVNYQTSTTASLNNSYDSQYLTGLTASVTPTYTHTSPQNIPGLVRWYKCNNISGTTLVDELNTSNNLALTGTPVWTTGKHDGGVNVTSTNSHCAWNDPFLGSTAFSFVEWTNKTHVTYGSPICDYETGKRNVLMYETSTNGELQFFVGDGTNTNNVVSTGFTDGKWHMIAGVFNASTHELSLYMDGVKTSGTETITSIGAAQASACWLNSFPPQGTYWHGVIDDIQMYNRSLSSTEVNELYYDNIQNLTLQTNADAVSTVNINDTNTYNVPYQTSDGTLSSFTASVPRNITTSTGISIYDYTNTISPFTVNMAVITTQKFQPIASFTENITSGTRPVTVQFTNTSQNLPDTFNWNFGDGQTSTDMNPTHTYVQSGLYTVSLTAINMGGTSTSTQTNVITITPSQGDVGLLNNSKRIAVYMREGSDIVAHDTYCTSMFYEYNLSYLTNQSVFTNITITPANYDLIVVEGNAMSNTSCAVLSNYIDIGGHVLFLADPVTDQNVTSLYTVSRIPQLGTCVQPDIIPGYGLTINGSDILCTGLTSSVTNTINTGAYYSWARTQSSPYGFANNIYHSVSIYAYGNTGVLVRFWNNNGSRVVYGNPNLFISGGVTDYCNRSMATTLWINTKDYLLGLDSNQYQTEITYPKSDKILTACIDDMYARDSDIPPCSSYFAWKDSIGYPTPDTYFIIQGDATTKTGLDYFSRYGDTHTIHPHTANGFTLPDGLTSWQDTNLVPGVVGDIQLTVLSQLQKVDTIYGTTDYGFKTVRFPSTNSKIPGFLVFANLGFTGSCNYGPQTGMGPIGTTNTNNMEFPKQKILYGNKTSLIEYETPAHYDIDSANGNAWYNDNHGQLQEFEPINFPAVYSIGGHEQQCMSLPDMLSNDTRIYSYLDQSSTTSFESIGTISAYTLAVKQSSIKAVSLNNGVEVIVTAPIAINNFTVKMSGLQNGIHATLDGSDLGLNNTRFEDGYYYVFCNIPTGTHTFIISDSIGSVTGTWISKTGALSLPIVNNGIVIKNNAGTTKTVSLVGNTLYGGALNNLTSTGNILSINRTKFAYPLSIQVSTNSNVNVSNVSQSPSVITFTGDNTNGGNTEYAFTGLTPNSNIVIKRNGVIVGSGTTDSSGNFDWVYTGMLGNYNFELDITPESSTYTSIATLTSVFTLFGIVPFILVVSGILVGFRTKRYEITFAACSVAVVIFLVIAFALIVLSQFNGA